MALAIGIRLGSYDIVSKLGEGGMGEVYRARDTRLDRDVALKVLPDSVARDRERLARFEREAKLLASLSHPNIAALYALEQLDGKPVLVMELAPGEDLAVRIDRGAIPLHDALPIATNLALALEAAHERGIVHRDLKPSNIKLDAEGVVKVLDFGLAKAFAPEDGSSPDAMNSPTLTAQATAAGVILGTAAYMSPEQARGRAADKRADIWAFGVVAFEMLTGKRLFAGETISDTLAAVLRQEIDWTSLPGDTPTDLVRLLKRCLERDRKNRLHDIADARIVLEEIQRGGAAAGTAVPTPARVARRGPVWIAAAAVLAALAVGVLAGRWSRELTVAANASGRTIRLAFTKPVGVDWVNDPVVASDGSFIVFSGTTGSQTVLYVQRFDELTPRPLAGTEGAGVPFLSPDNRWIGYTRHDRTYKISVDGGDPLVLVENLASNPGAAWLLDGTILAPQTWSSGLFAYAAGSAPRAVTKPDAARGERGHWFPHLLPDGRHAIFTIMRNGSGLNDADVAILDVASGTYRVVMPGADPAYLAPGYLVFFRAGSYQAIRFDLASLQVSGEPVRVLEDARGPAPDGEASKVSVGSSGIVAYRNGPHYLDSKLTLVAEGGALEPLPFPARPYVDLDLAPDGRHAAGGAVEGGRFVLRLLDFDRRTDDVLDLPGSNWDPHWNPDGRRLAIRSMKGGQYDTYQLDLAGGPPTPLLVTDRDDMPEGWTFDGKFVLVRQANEKSGYPLYKMDPDHPESMTRLLDSGDLFAASPDGHWLAFTSSRSEREELYVQPMSANARPQRVSTQGATALSWSRKGHELFYARGLEIIAVSYREEQGQFKVEKERVWATVKGLDAEKIFEATPDGRIIIDLPPTPPPPPQIRVVLGLDKELERKFGK